MKILIIVLFSISMLMSLSVSIFMLFKRKTKTSNYLLCAIVSSVVVTALYIIMFFINDYFIKSVLFSLLYISMDFLCFFLFLFFIYFSDDQIVKTKRYKWFLLACFVFVFADIIMFLINPSNEITLGYEKVVSDGVLYLVGVGHGWFYAHLAFCYILLILGIVATVNRLFRFPNEYKFKYIIIIGLVFIATIVNLTYLVIVDVYIDYSIAMYGIIAYLLFFFDSYFNQLIIGKAILLKYLDNNTDATFIFDNKDDLCYQNLLAKQINTDSFSDFNLIKKELVTFCSKNDTDNYEYKDKIYRVLFKDIFNKKSELLGRSILLTDITELKKTQKKMEFLATHDEDTGLFKYGHLFNILSQTIPSGQRENTVLTAIDIENFSRINTVFGNVTGDMIINILAQKIFKLSKETRTYCARYKADIFVIFSSLYTNKLGELFTRLSKEMNDEFVSFHLVLKAGMYVLRSNDEFNEAFNKALLACDNVKTSSPTHYALYDDRIEQNDEYKKQLLKDFDDAIKNEEFKLYLQPQVNSFNNEVYGAEALVRWQHPLYGLIPPNDFIPLLETNGLIHILDKYVYYKAGEIVAKLQKTNLKNIPISVNVSPIDLYYLNICEIFEDVVRKNNIDKKLFAVEITETAVMSNKAKAISQIRELRERGFVIELDDFGSGYSSLNALKDIPTNIIKLDMRFISDYTNLKNKKILDGIVKMIQSIDLGIIVEGVEVKEQVDYLRDLKCHIIQGYYYSKPVPYEEFINYTVNK